MAPTPLESKDCAWAPAHRHPYIKKKKKKMSIALQMVVSLYSGMEKAMFQMVAKCIF